MPVYTLTKNGMITLSKIYDVNERDILEMLNSNPLTFDQLIFDIAQARKFCEAHNVPGEVEHLDLLIQKAHDILYDLQRRGLVMKSSSVILPTQSGLEYCLRSCGTMGGKFLCLLRYGPKTIESVVELLRQKEKEHRAKNTPDDTRQANEYYVMHRHAHVFLENLKACGLIEEHCV
jgi:hypothetical protein